MFVVNVALPPETVLVAMGLAEPLLKKPTVPPAEEGVTVAVNVTALPIEIELVEETSAVAVEVNKSPQASARALALMEPSPVT